MGVNIDYGITFDNCGRLPIQLYLGYPNTLGQRLLARCLDNRNATNYSQKSPENSSCAVHTANQMAVMEAIVSCQFHVALSALLGMPVHACTVLANEIGNF